MNCHEFEKQISDYIDGLLKAAKLKDFSEHHGSCNSCKNKVNEIRDLLEFFPRMNRLETSTNFMEKLSHKIDEYENNTKFSFWKNLSSNGILGIQFPSAIGIAAAMFIFVGASYMLLNQDKIPEIDYKKLSINANGSNKQKINLLDSPTEVADRDTSSDYENGRTYNGPINLVKGKK